MREITLEPDLQALLWRLEGSFVVLDYVFLELLTEDLPCVTTAPEQLHRAAAITGMAVIARRQEEEIVPVIRANPQYTPEMFFHIQADETKLTGYRESFSTFWGTDDVELKGNKVEGWTVPNVDGYKTAFFLPPHSLNCSVAEANELFAAINKYIFGDEPERAEIFSWSTDWSNYFDAGHEWWGAFLWSIRAADLRQFVVIGASATD